VLRIFKSGRRCSRSSVASHHKRVCSYFNMSAAFDAAPPNTRGGGDDDALRTQGANPMNAPEVKGNNDTFVAMDEYRRDVPLWKRVHQHSLTQMLLISVQAFCGPAMSDAIAGACQALSSE
jgi:hypothetical protein